MIPDLSLRRLHPELMDDPGLDPARHVRALRALETVNALSWTAGRVWRAVMELAPAPGRPLRVLDVACGGGDVAVSLVRRARQTGLALEVHACDLSPLALEHARAAAGRAGVDVRFFLHDALATPFPDHYDLIASSLLLHHFTEAEVIALLRAKARAADHVLVQDLRRTRLGWALAVLTLHTVARSDVARVDGLRSVAGAFTMEEAESLARQAGLDGATVRPCWPQRFTLSWRRP